MTVVVAVWLSAAVAEPSLPPRASMRPTSAPQTVEAWIAREMAGRGHLPSLADVLAFAEREMGLVASKENEAWPRSAMNRAWIPSIDARVGTDRSLDVRDATTSSWVRTGQGFGLQLRLRWSLADALYNDEVLRIEKTLRARRAARWRTRDRLVNLYFERLELEIKLLTAPKRPLWLKAAQIDGLLQAATGRRLTYGRRAGNPWPRTSK